MESIDRNVSTDNARCIHLLDSGECGILRVKTCDGKSCSFCETEAQNKNAAQRWQERLCSIDEALQMKIAGTYYGGKRPWLNKKEVS